MHATHRLMKSFHVAKNAVRDGRRLSTQTAKTSGTVGRIAMYMPAFDLEWDVDNPQDPKSEEGLVQGRLQGLQLHRDRGL